MSSLLELLKWEVSEVHFAFARSDIKALRILKELGADLNIRDKNGKTPAHKASQIHENVYKVLSFVKELGMELNAQDREGRTPAHIAAHWDQLEVLQTLAKLRVDLSIQNNDGLTAIQIHKEKARRWQPILCSSSLNKSEAN